MGHWSGWVAAVAGILSVVGIYVSGQAWLEWVGALGAIVFGVWAAAAK